MSAGAFAWGCAQSHVPSAVTVQDGQDGGGWDGEREFPLLFAASQDGFVSVIDLDGLRMVTAVGGGARGMRTAAVASGQHTFYLPDADQGTVRRVRLEGTIADMTAVEDGVYPIGGTAHIVDLSPDGRMLAAFSGVPPIERGLDIPGRPGVTLLDVEGGRVLAALGEEVGYPGHGYFTPQGDRLLVALVDARAVVELTVPDLTEVGRVPIGTESARARLRAERPDAIGPLDMHLTHDGSTLYTADLAMGTVTVLDPSPLRWRGALLEGVGSFPHDMASPPDGSELWVVDIGFGVPVLESEYQGTRPWLRIVDLEDGAERAAIEPERAPMHVTITPDADRVYVGTTDGHVQVFDLASREHIADVATAAATSGTIVQTLAY